MEFYTKPKEPEQEQEAQRGQAASPKDKTNRRRLLVIGGVAAVLLLIIGLVVAYFVSTQLVSTQEQTTSAQSKTPSSSAPSSSSKSGDTAPSSKAPNEAPPSKGSEAAPPQSKSQPQGQNQAPEQPSAAAPAQAGVPSGYVLEKGCDQGIGATGKTIYYKPLNVPGRPETGRNYWIECVHPKGEDGVVGRNDVATTSSGLQLKKANPYCALSDVDRNIGCALESITKTDLMNPS